MARQVPRTFFLQPQNTNEVYFCFASGSQLGMGFEPYTRVRMHSGLGYGGLGVKAFDPKP